MTKPEKEVHVHDCMKKEKKNPLKQYLERILKGPLQLVSKYDLRGANLKC